jgi:hypothetical protein
MKNFRFLLSLIMVGSMGVAACSAARVSTGNSVDNSSNSEKGADQNTSDGAAGKSDLDQAIRKIDFKNGFTYDASCAGEETTKITVKNGEYSRETKEKDADYVDHFYFGIDNITYGDVDGDNKEDAIILSTCNTGGTGQFTEGFVYTIKTGKPTLLTRIEGGDRADGGLHTANMDGGLLAVERYDEGEGGGACCPEYSITTRYKWNGKELQVMKTDPRKALYPPEKVSFAKGATKTTIKATVDDIKRYSVGARAGQTMIVTVDTDKATVSLSKGEADVTDGTNSFTAKLNANGEFVVQVQNIGEKPVAVTVTIEIR